MFVVVKNVLIRVKRKIIDLSFTFKLKSNTKLNLNILSKTKRK